jgi:hypothetical protein
VITQGPGLSAEEIERYITIPIETQTSGLRNLTSIRTISLYGLSDVKLQFSFDFTYEEALQQVLNRLSQLPPLPNNAQPQISPVSPIFKIEEYCLGVLFRTPEMLYRLDRRLEEYGLSPLAVEDFGYTDHQLLFGVVRQSIEQDEKDHHHFALTNLPETLEGLSRELLAHTATTDPLEDRVLEDLVNRFIDLRRMVAQSNVAQLRFLQEDEQQNGAVNLKMYQEQALQFTRLLQSLDQAKRKLALKRQA